MLLIIALSFLISGRMATLQQNAKSAFPNRTGFARSACLKVTFVYGNNLAWASNSEEMSTASTFLKFGAM
jgi:hypothetical protein